MQSHGNAVSGENPYDTARLRVADAFTDLHDAVDDVCRDEHVPRALDVLETRALTIIHATARLREIRREEAMAQFAEEAEEEGGNS